LDFAWSELFSIICMNSCVHYRWRVVLRTERKVGFPRRVIEIGTSPSEGKLTKNFEFGIFLNPNGIRIKLLKPGTEGELFGESNDLCLHTPHQRSNLFHFVQEGTLFKVVIVASSSLSITEDFSGRVTVLIFVTVIYQARFQLSKRLMFQRFAFILAVVPCLWLEFIAGQNVSFEHSSRSIELKYSIQKVPGLVSLALAFVELVSEHHGYVTPLDSF